MPNIREKLKIIFLSYSLDINTPAYGNGDSIGIDPVKRIDRGDSCNTSLWHLPNHLGTHIDSPKHFFNNGRPIDAYEPDFWIFNKITVLYVKIGDTKQVCFEDIIPFLKKDTDLLLIKSIPERNREKREYWEENYGLSPYLGHELRRNYKFLRAVGVDSISVSSWQNRAAGKKAHRTFLDPSTTGHPILLIEDMDLSQIHYGISIKKVVVLPIRIKGADASPCSIIAEVITDDQR